MGRRHMVAVALAVGLLSSCGTDEETDRPGDSPSGARSAVESYVKALNARDTSGLIEAGGVPDDSRSRREARRILADKGGRGLSIVDVRIDFDMGPDVGSAKLTAQEKSGKDVRDVFSVQRDKGAWHLAIFTDRPMEPGKSPASTDEP